MSVVGSTNDGTNDQGNMKIYVLLWKKFDTSQQDWEQIYEKAHVQHGKYLCSVFLCHRWRSLTGKYAERCESLDKKRAKERNKTDFITRKLCGKWKFLLYSISEQYHWPHHSV